MTAKPAIFYTVRRPSYHTPGMTYAVLAVTSEGPADRLNGRYQDGAPTHCRRYNTFGRFNTEADALARIADIDAIVQQYAGLIKPLHSEMCRLYAEQDAEIYKLIEQTKS